MEANTLMNEQRFASCEVRFYTVDDLIDMLGWSKTTVLKLFNDPKFPATDFGRNKVVEAHALVDYFSVRHEKKRDRYWK